MGITLSVPRGDAHRPLKPRITVVGVGGAGSNAVNNMIAKNLEGVDFIVANTDAQSLSQSCTDRRIQLGVHTTEGLGAGARPEVGRAAAEEALEDIQRELSGSHMAFLTAGMGGGTGTGAGPVVARAAREMGILTVGVVTKPFHFEGIHRMRLAEVGMDELARYVDTLIIIPNQNLFRVANERTTFAQAFHMADDVLYAGVRGVTDLIMMPGLINLDFADIRTVMSEMGKAMMGTGESDGDKRALEAAEAAISNPLLDDMSMKGARGVLINITGGPDMTLYEVDEAANRVRDEVDPDANIIFGSTFDEQLDGRIRVSVVATGIDSEASIQSRRLDTVVVREESRSSPMSSTVRRMSDALHTSTANVTTSLRADKTAEEHLRPYKKALPTETAVVQKIGESPISGPEAAEKRQGLESFAALTTERHAESGCLFEAFIPAPAMEPHDLGRSSPASTCQDTTPGLRASPEEVQRTALRPQASAVQHANAKTTEESFLPVEETSLPVMPPPIERPLVRRPQTLLEKVVGIGRIRRTTETPEKNIPQHQSTYTLKVKSGDQPTSTVEENLDIPAFLRRQAN